MWTFKVIASAAVFAVVGVLSPIAGCADHLSDCLWSGACYFGTQMTGSGGGGGGNPMCVPRGNGSAVDDSCGVFVSSSVGDDANAGTKASPVKTLAKALEVANAAGQPVYACAEVFDEAVTTKAGSVVYGGLACAQGWIYAGDTKKTSIVPSVDASAATQIALMLSGGAGTTHIEDVSVTSPDAMQAGGSSIAALADGGDVELVRCELVSGNGMTGSKGATPSDPVGPSDPNDPAIRGVDGAAACMGNGSGNLGGAGTTNATCMTAKGGDGGTGHEMQGDSGSDGQPLPSPNPDGWGLGGIGAMAGTCKPGQPGFLGSDGASGAGASASLTGTLTSTGFVGTSGQPGTEGAPGQGGGGGGGAKGKMAGAGCSTGNGASGGGGGAGGCGGKGGLGGQGGGASIALASVGATVMLKEVTLSSRNGGDGGEGGDGQDGGTGGVGGLGGPGSGTLPACDGGKGGVGGFGGKGGGGRGGPSLGIAYTGTAPLMDGGSFKSIGQPGKGGPGADASGMGADGMKAETLNLSQ